MIAISIVTVALPSVKRPWKQFSRNQIYIYIYIYIMRSGLSFENKAFFENITFLEVINGLECLVAPF